MAKVWIVERRHTVMPDDPGEWHPEQMFMTRYEADLRTIQLNRESKERGYRQEFRVTEYEPRKS
jgi:hypothetical protein